MSAAYEQFLNKEVSMRSTTDLEYMETVIDEMASLQLDESLLNQLSEVFFE